MRQVAPPSRLNVGRILTRRAVSARGFVVLLCIPRWLPPGAVCLLLIRRICIVTLPVLMAGRSVGLTTVSEPEVLDARGHLANELDRYLTAEQLRLLIDEVLKVTKNVRAEMKCKHCGRGQVVYAEMSDAKAVASAMADLMTQAKGRPGEQREDASVTVNRRVILVTEEGGAA